jgi:hypothetical protein
MHMSTHTHLITVLLFYHMQNLNTFLTLGLEKCLWQWSPLQINTGSVFKVLQKFGCTLQNWLSCYAYYDNTYQRWACSQIPASLTHFVRVLASGDPTRTDASLPVYGYYIPLPLSILDNCRMPAVEKKQIFGLNFSGTQADFSHWDNWLHN